MIRSTLDFQFQMAWQPPSVAWLTWHITYWWSMVLDHSFEEFLSSERTRWPFVERPFHELAAWLNVELMKNAAEIGYCRFLYAVRGR